MTLALLSFFAGVLTVLAPCVLPMLPVILGGSLGQQDGKKPLILIASLSVSIIVFTLLLKATTAFIAIPDSFWKGFSAAIIGIFGLTLVFPHLWEKLMTMLKLNSQSQQLLQSAGNKEGITGTILLGAALGPVFSSCSPTYFLILATVLPASFLQGIFYLILYTLGLALLLFAIVKMGRSFTKKAQWASDPNGWFKKSLGVLLLIVAISIFTGFDKTFESFLLDQGWGNIGRIEEHFIDSLDE